MNSYSKAILAIVLSCLFLGCRNSRIENIYISLEGNDVNKGTIASPLLSIERAKQKLIEFAKEGDAEKINIIFRQGTYPSFSTFTLDDPQYLNGSISITFKAHEDEKVVLSGGLKLSDWKVLNNGNWETDLDDDVYFEQLYVNGRMATRARTPNKTAETSQWFLRKADYELDPEGEMKKLEILFRKAHLEGFEYISYGEIIILKDWATFRKQISGIVPEENKINIKLPVTKPTKKQGEHNSLYSTNRQPGYSAYLEGHPAFVDDPGEWALDIDLKKVIYRPMPGESIDNSEIYHPVISELILLKGNKENKIRNIHFENICFSHTGYWLPETGHDGTQAAMYYTGDRNDIRNENLVLPEAVRLEFAENCSFSSCTFLAYRYMLHCMTDKRKCCNTNIFYVHTI